jgi:hypothetical protein
VKNRTKTYAQYKNAYPAYCRKCRGAGVIFAPNDHEDSLVHEGGESVESTRPCPECLHQGQCPQCRADMDGQTLCTACGWMLGDEAPDKAQVGEMVKTNKATRPLKELPPLTIVHITRDPGTRYRYIVNLDGFAFEIDDDEIDSTVDEELGDIESVPLFRNTSVGAFILAEMSQFQAISVIKWLDLRQRVVHRFSLHPAFIDGLLELAAWYLDVSVPWGELAPHFAPDEESDETFDRDALLVYLKNANVLVNEDLLTLSTDELRGVAGQVPVQNALVDKTLYYIQPSIAHCCVCGHLFPTDVMYVDNATGYDDENPNPALRDIPLTRYKCRDCIW